MSDEADDTAKGNSEPKRRGRRPGAGKVPGSGRKAGTPNRTTAEVKAMILRRGRPLELLCDVAAGVKIRIGAQAGPGAAEYQYPSLSERLMAARVLLAKVTPDVKAVELSGPDGGPVETVAVNPEERAEALRALGDALRKRRAEAPADIDPPAVPRPGVVKYEPPPRDYLPNDDVMAPYELRADGSTVVVLRDGVELFRAIDRTNALTFISQHQRHDA